MKGFSSIFVGLLLFTAFLLLLLPPFPPPSTPPSPPLSQITVILLNWVSSHFPDFEGHDYMSEFLEWFEAVLLEDVSHPLFCIYPPLPFT